MQIDAKQIMLLLGILGAFCVICDCSPAEGKSLARVQQRFEANRSVSGTRDIYDSLVPAEASEAEGESILKK